MTEETQAEQTFENAQREILLQPLLIELTKANKYLKNISMGVSFFVVITILGIVLAACGLV